MSKDGLTACVQNQSGENGFAYLTSGTTAGNFAFLVVDQTAAFSATTNDKGDDLPIQTRAEGVIVAGNFDSVTVSSGTVRAYYSE